MNRIKDYGELEDRIVKWISDYCITHPKIKSLVVGISGGIDSSVVSTLCALTGMPTYVVGMPINQLENQESLSDAHGKWLESKFTNVKFVKTDMSHVYDSFLETICGDIGEKFATNKLAQANTRSRLRMVTLYQIAGSVNGIVVGTGNKVEDYGVGFYTKYGDGGIDIAPIADLYKTEVWMLGEHLGVDERIISAAPTDGLWDDGRTDTDQLGASYEMLEWVMESGITSWEREPIDKLDQWMGKPLTQDQKNAVEQYVKFNTQNKHKMVEIPTFKL
jgi:NAD+ synthase